MVRFERERSAQIANIPIPDEIAKQKAIIETQAEAERIKENAKGDADTIFAKMDTEVKGLLKYQQYKPKDTKRL